MHLPNTRRPLALIATAVALCCALMTRPASSQEKSFEIYGFAMADWIQDTKRVDPNWQDAFRPSRIAAPEGEFGANGQSSLSVKQSRFGVKGTMPTGDNTAPINFKFEFDMFGVGSDAGKTTIRLRHAYGEWGQFLAGQTHSLFMDIDVFPNVIDYWGPAGMVFFRNVQFRWTGYRTQNDSIAVAIEKPSNDVDAGNIRLVEGYDNAVVNPDQIAPDLTGQWRHDDNWGHFQVAGILRAVGYQYSLNGEPFQKSHQTGWGVDVTAALNMLEKDKLLLSVVHGNGIASYMNDGGMDVAPTSTPSNNPVVPTIAGEAVPLTGVMVYYDHYWSDHFWGSAWSTSIGYSFTQVDNTNFQTATTFHKGEYASINLLAYPASKVMVGVELMYGKNYNNSNQCTGAAGCGATGNDVRFQLSAKYDFGTKL